jgi:hypothetical protein
MTKRVLTAGDIARLIQEPGEDLRAIGERLRHWTKEGLLKPIGRPKGTGHHLRYPERALVDAAILSRLTQRYGLWAKKVPFISALLDIAVNEIPKMPQHIQKKQTVYLFLSTVAGKFSGSVQKVDDPEGPARLFWLRLSVERDFEDAIIINLNLLFEKVGVPLDEDQKGKT